MHFNSSSRFAEEISSTMILIRNAFGDILYSLNVSLNNPKDVYKMLKIDNKLGWKIYSVMCEVDPFIAAQYVPGKSACMSFVKSCKKLGTPEKLLRKVNEVCEQFNLMVEKHSDSRNGFNLMMLSFSEKGRSKAYQSQQKAAFLAFSHLLGVHANTQLATWILAPSDSRAGNDKPTVDVANITGFVDFQRNRPNVPWLLEWAFFSSDDDYAGTKIRTFPLENEELDKENPTKVPFYYSFCSEPLPIVSSSRNYDGRTIFELDEGPVGNTESITYLTGQISRNVFKGYRTAKNNYRNVKVRSRTPVERLLFDQIIHKDLLGPGEPELYIFGEFTGYDQAASADQINKHCRLPIDVFIQKLGTGISSTYTTHIPWYTKMLEDAFTRLQWDPSEFTTYRAVIDYPIIPSTIHMRSILPEEKVRN